MRVTCLWFGGPSYAAPTDEDAERFPSLRVAKEVFADRLGDPYTPCVSDDPENGASMWVFAGDDVLEYPDWILRFGPRGGVVQERG